MKSRPPMHVGTSEELDRFAPYLVTWAQISVSTVKDEGLPVISLLARIEGEGGEAMDVDLMLSNEHLNQIDLAADLMGAAEGIIHQLNISAGLDHREGELILRKLRKKAERDRRVFRDNIVSTPELHCAYCPRLTAVIVDGVRYCKRHAEEHGVREKGKIS